MVSERAMPLKSWLPGTPLRTKPVEDTFAFRDWMGVGYPPNFLGPTNTATEKPAPCTPTQPRRERDPYKSVKSSSVEQLGFQLEGPQTIELAQ